MKLYLHCMSSGTTVDYFSSSLKWKLKVYLKGTPNLNKPQTEVSNITSFNPLDAKQNFYVWGICAYYWHITSHGHVQSLHKSIRNHMGL